MREGRLIILTQWFILPSPVFCELGLVVLQLCCKWADKVTRVVDQTAEQLLGDRVLPAWLDIIFLHLAPSHTCNRVVVHMNAHSTAGIELCFRSHCFVINKSQQVYVTSVLAWKEPNRQLLFFV